MRFRKPIPDYYRILQVDPDADPKVIERVYRTLMLDLRAHPDLGGDTERAQRINEAYAVLSRPERRAAYDRRRRVAGLGSPASRDGPATCPHCGARTEVTPAASPGAPLRCPACGRAYRDLDRELRVVARKVAQVRDANLRWWLQEKLKEARHWQRRAEDAVRLWDDGAARAALLERRKLLDLMAPDLG